MAKILVVGGAGYIGSTACTYLREQGHQVWVLDDLSTGFQKLILDERHLKCRAGDKAQVTALLERERFDSVMHFAASALVSESVKNPQKYFENNVEQTRSLLESMISTGTQNFIFSSTCAIFGIPTTPKISEKNEKNPINPYGQTKLEVELLLASLAASKGLRSIALRYFNAAGTDPKLRTGEMHDPETHLIPNILKAVALNKTVQILGTDYPTPDGTSVRDYIHVWDLAEAHSQAMQRLLAAGTKNEGIFEAYNLGSQQSYSVREVIAACEKVTGKKIQVELRPRRPGDPHQLVADSTLARQVLQFNPRFTLEDCIRDAWAWYQKIYP